MSGPIPGFCSMDNGELLSVLRRKELEVQKMAA